MRDFSGDVFAVHHCLLEDIEALGEADTIYYMGCPECRKKTCDHGLTPVPVFLANILFMTFDQKVQAKGIGSVIESLLEIPAEHCVPDAHGIQEKLENALQVARGRPYNVKFIISQFAQANKNVLELVDVKQTVELLPSSPLTHFPNTTLKLVPCEVQGCPPCTMKDMKLENGLKLIFGKPVNTVQLLVTICDSGSERGCLKQDGELVRITRQAMCALSGVNLSLHRTDELAKSAKYCKWNKGDVVYVIGRVMTFDANEKVWQISMTADRQIALATKNKCRENVITYSDTIVL